MTYKEKLRHPRWQEKRLQLMGAAGFVCEGCGDNQTMLAVHHRYYRRGADPWDYEDEAFKVLCEPCHLTAQQDLDALHQQIGTMFLVTVPQVIGMIRGMEMLEQEGGSFSVDNSREVAKGIATVWGLDPENVYRYATIHNDGFVSAAALRAFQKFEADARNKRQKWVVNMNRAEAA